MKKWDHCEPADLKSNLASPGSAIVSKNNSNLVPSLMASNNVTVDGLSQLAILPKEQFRTELIQTFKNCLPHTS